MSISDEEEKIRIKLGAKLATEVETLNGLIVLFHDEPFPDDVIELLKTMTKEQIEREVLGSGFESHDIDQYFNN